MKLLTPNATVSREVYLGTVVAQVAVVLVLWTLSHPVILPTPWAVVRALGGLWHRGVFTEELLKSFVVNLKALAWSTGLSLVLAYLTVVPFARFPVSALSKFRFLGLTGLTLPFTLWFPNGDSLRVAILTFAMTASFLTTMSDVVATIPLADFDHVRTIKMSNWRGVWEVVVLGRADQAFEVLRQNAAIGWMMLTMVEVISQSGGGIGLVLYKANKQLNLLPEVFAILLVILMVGYFQDQAISWLKRTVCPYAELTLERR